jgi:hypothetical protein
LALLLDALLLLLRHGETHLRRRRQVAADARQTGDENHRVESKGRRAVRQENFSALARPMATFL